MRNLNEIRQHIRAVSQTRKITNAMYLLSTSRMRRAIARADRNREYFQRVRTSMRNILARSETVTHPYLKENAGKRAAFIVIAADKGLCGNYNESVLNLAYDRMRRFEETYLVTIGIVATQFFVKKGIHPDLEYLGVAQNPTMSDARNIIEDVFEAYDAGIMDQVFIVSTRFINSFVQRPHCARLLPLELEDYIDIDTDVEQRGELVFLPSDQVAFDMFVPQYAIGLLYGALVQAIASEHCARMNAMQKATENADDMLDHLGKEYNMARQYAVTREVIEITSAASAMKESS